MPRTMLTDQHWQKLKTILRNLSILRAHQHSAGIANQSISKSVEGNSSKIHLIVDANGNPVDFMITDGT
ncbi:IS5/IS1182 family transposase, partial [Acinetobacter lwoffii]|nr:IS5/IS1182 family transposase [Acinetobacter lwoffii]